MNFFPMKIRKVIVAILFFSVTCLSSQIAQNADLKKWSLGGYISNMQTIMDIDTLKGYWLYQSQFHNRLNLGFYPVSPLFVSIQARTRILFGDLIRMDLDGQYAKSMNKESGWMDLSFNLATGRSYIFNTTIDRLYFQLELNKFWITLGRQRFNWGQTFVWNPNDWFNTYSFFDFDYEERQGSDAVRLRYFTGFTSSAEIAAKLDSAKNVTAAFLLKMNKWQYDLQLLGGVLASEDYGIGLGWSGQIKNIGFRGEMNYFHPIKNPADTSGLFFMSIGFDYVFSNSLMIQCEGLYNQQPKGFDETGFIEYYQKPLSVKDLSFTEWNFFGQISYPFTPLLSGTLSAMFYPKIDGFFLGPSISYSLANNFDFSLFFQIFSGEYQIGEDTDERHNIHLGFARFKYNF